MSEDGDTKPPASVPWYQSSQIRAALGLLIPGVLSLAHILHLDKKLGIDLDNFSADSIMGIITFIGYLLTLVIGPIAACIFWIVKRVKAGLNPDSTAPEIIPPAAVRVTVEAVKRLTE